MKGFKEKSFSERRSAATDARQAALERFRARPAQDDPEVVKRKVERLALAEARAKREEERRAIKEAEAKARAEQEAKDRAEREAREKREAIERVIRESSEAADRKALRDARYAARKARQGKK